MFEEAFAFAHDVLKEQGKYPHLVDIEQRSNAVDDYGHKLGWVLFDCEVPASVVPVGATERTDNHQAQPEVTHMVYLDFQEGITPTMRLIYNGRILEISSVVNVGERSLELQISCTESV